MPRLSICIPTYKRSRLLAELLDSIIGQGISDLEVIVSDDASPDDTAEVAQRYHTRIANFTFIRQPENIGLDRNFLAVVEAATGDYVWLMGDDDRIEPGGARRVLDALDRWPGVIGLTLGVIDYDPTMHHPTGVRLMPKTQLLQGVSQTFATLAEHLGFMSALVADRAKWMAVATDDSVREFQNYYVQYYITGRIIGRDGPWGVVQEPCVGFRTDNDQLQAKFGWLQRMKIDVVAYEQIAHAVLVDDPAAQRVMRERIFDAHVLTRVRGAKLQPGRAGSVLPAAMFLFGHYKDLPSFWTKAIPTLLVPNWSVRAARVLYKRFAKSSGTARARDLAAR